MTTLNTYQQEAVSFNGKHLLVLAGAGTGKTKTIIARAEHLLKSGVPPHKIVILSFTRKSANEIAERVKASVSAQLNVNAITGRTFHSWCNEIMAIYKDFFPQSGYTLLDEDDQISAMGLAIGKELKDSSGKKLKAKTVVSIYSYAVNTLCSLSTSIKHIKYFNTTLSENELTEQINKDKAVITPVIKKYIEYKKTRLYIDYDDMLNIVANALHKNEKAREVISKKWEHILVDEMQDTNPLQYKLLNAFTEHSHLFCVGDDAQSIYGFRGADFKTINSFTEIVTDSEVCKLLLNYRSTQEILDLSNWLLKQSKINYNKELKAYRGLGKKPKLIHTDSEWEEANVITDDILHCVNEREFKHSDIMVLGRSSWSLSKVEGACIQKKIPYKKYGGTQLMQTAHVRDVASALRIVANHYDEIAWIRYLTLWEGIGNVTATKLIAHILTLTDFNSIINILKYSRNQSVISAISETLEEVYKHLEKPSKAIENAVKYMDGILSKKYADEWANRVMDFSVLEEVGKNTSSITEFITEYILDPSAETTLKDKDVNKDAVILSTIHSAKGLEAKSVHIVNLNTYSYPSQMSLKKGEDAIEEERRCLYVALTRAKDELNLYRNKLSLHTQNQKKDDFIKLRTAYKSKLDETNVVFTVNKSSNGITVLNKKGQQEIIPLKQFDQQFEKVIKEEHTENLYFLNNLPTELVDIEVINNELRATQKIDTSKTADMPDFNFD